MSLALRWLLQRQLGLMSKIFITDTLHEFFGISQNVSRVK